jgi:UDP-glucose 4-epimerase
VGFDFVCRLLADPTALTLLGDGTQSKSYVFVTDVVDAVLRAAEDGDRPYDVYNVATGDHITVNEIASIAMQCLDLDPASVEVTRGSGDRGWKGDVPVVRLDTRRIRALGWRQTRTSAEALRDSIMAMRLEVGASRR